MNAHRFGLPGTRRCRRSGYPAETIHHIIGCCNKSVEPRKLRDNALLDRLVRAALFARRLPEVERRRLEESLEVDLGSELVLLGNSRLYLSRSVPECDRSDLRPDFALIGDAARTAVIADVVVPFESAGGALDAAREAKRQKYAVLAEELRAMGYRVVLDALVVGAFGPGIQTTRVSSLHYA